MSRVGLTNFYYLDQFYYTRYSEYPYNSQYVLIDSGLNGQIINTLKSKPTRLRIGIKIEGGIISVIRFADEIV